MRLFKLLAPSSVQDLTVNNGGRGYFAGGVNGAGTSYYAQIDGIDFLTESGINPAAALSLGRFGAAGISSSIKGYACGGRSAAGVQVAAIDGIDFAAETAINPAAVLATIKRQARGMSSATAGYIAGGLATSSATPTNVIERFTFATEVNAVIAAILSTPTGRAASSETDSYGYYMCGATAVASGNASSGQDEFAFSTESKTPLSAALAVRESTDANASTSVCVMALGCGNTAALATLEQFAFATRTNSNIGSFTTGRLQPAAVTSSKIGYWGGGTNFAATNQYTTIDSYTYASGTISTPAAPTLATGRYGLTGLSSPASPNITPKGYFLGGYTTASSAEIDGINFNTDAAVNPSAVLATARQGGVGVNSSRAGYIMGGNTATTTATALSSIAGFDFSTEVSTSVTATMGAARYQGTGISSSLKGYSLGGRDTSGVPTTLIYSIIFSNETTQTPSSVLSGLRFAAAGLTSDTVGYVSGGYNGSNYQSVIDSLIYSSETFTGSVASLTTARTETAGACSTTAGYTGGGISGGTPLASIERLTFSSTTNAAISAVLATARGGLAGVNSSSTGYWGGGYNNSTTRYTEIDGIEFNGESAVNPSAALVASRYWLTSLTNTVADIFYPRAYFGGGWNGTTRYTEIDGIDFTVLVSINPSAVLATSRYLLGGTSSSIRGYFAGGFTTTYSNAIDGFDFTSETAINPAATLATARDAMASGSSIWKGYYFGGYTGSVSGEIDGINFSTEAAYNPAVALSTAKQNVAAINNATQVIIAAGTPASGTADNVLNTFTTTTETYGANSATLSVARNGGHTPISSNDTGLFVGGRNGSNTYINTMDAYYFSTGTSTAVANFYIAIGGAGSGSYNNFGYVAGGVNNSIAQTAVYQISIGNNFSSTQIFQYLSTARYQMASIQSNLVV